MLCIYDEFSRLQFLSLPRIRWWRFSLALSWGYLSDFMQSGFSSSSTRSWITKVAGEALLVKTPRAPTSVIGKSQIKYLTGISALSRTGFKSLSQISNPYFSSNPNSFTVKSQIKSQIFRTVTVGLLTVSVVQLVRCSCGIKSHPKQKCFFFDDSCIPFCVGKQAADLSRLKFFPNRIAENFHQISNRITIFWTESLQFKSNLKICSNRNLNPITGPFVSPVWAVVMPMSKQPTLGSKHSAGWRPTTYDRIVATTLHSSMATPLKNKKIKNNSKNKDGWPDTDPDSAAKLQCSSYPTFRCPRYLHLAVKALHSTWCST